MKVKELREKLADLDENMDVFVQSDEEGNATRDLVTVELGYIREDYGTLTSVHPDDVDPQDFQAVILWP